MKSKYWIGMAVVALFLVGVIGRAEPTSGVAACSELLALKPRFDPVAAFLKSDTYAKRSDLHGSEVYVSPRGLILLKDASGNYYSTSIDRGYYKILGAKGYLREGLGLRRREERIAILLSLEPSEVEFDLKFNTTALDWNAEIRKLQDLEEAKPCDPLLAPIDGAPVLPVDTSRLGGDDSIPWENWIGRPINALLSGEIAPQKVMSPSQLSEVDPALVEGIRKLVDESTSCVREEGYFSEMGLWAYRQENGVTHFSKVFGSRQFLSITEDQAFLALKELLDRVSPVESDQVPSHLTLIHTHPGRGSPLSRTDLRTLAALARAMKLSSGDSVGVMAVPVGFKGNIVFGHWIHGTP